MGRSLVESWCFLHERRISLLESRMSLLECRIALLECRIALLENRISLFENRICPPEIHRDFDRYPPKWFWAITYTIWLRLEIQGLDSAWFFSAHLLFFQIRGRIFEPRTKSHVNMLARGPFGGQKLVPKKVVLRWSDFVMTVYGKISRPK